MRARLYVCDVCGEVEDKNHGGAFYIFRYKQKFSGCNWYVRHKMVMCHECFHKMLDFCRNDEEKECERPQGKWKTVEGVDGDEYYENNMNFCPNCGADMRGGAE